MSSRGKEREIEQAPLVDVVFVPPQDIEPNALKFKRGMILFHEVILQRWSSEQAKNYMFLVVSDAGQASAHILKHGYPEEGFSVFTPEGFEWVGLNKLPEKVAKKVVIDLNLE